MKILVAIDFGNTSFAAYCYANHLADAMNAELTLIHVIPSTSEINQYLDGDLLEGMKHLSEERLIDFTQKYPKDRGLKLKDVDTKYIITYGLPSEEILRSARNKGYDMVVMGVRDKLNFMSRLTGTTATEVMNGAKIPLIMVHSNSRCRVPNKMVFAFDKMEDLEEGVEDYLKINKYLKAKTDFVHVLNQGHNDIEDMKEEIVDELFDDADPEFSFQIKTIKEENTIQAIHDYCLFEKSDLLVMLHRKNSVWDLILNKSKTIKTAYDFHLPLLILPT